MVGTHLAARAMKETNDQIGWVQQTRACGESMGGLEEWHWTGWMIKTIGVLGMGVGRCSGGHFKKQWRGGQVGNGELGRVG